MGTSCKRVRATKRSSTRLRLIRACMCSKTKKPRLNSISNLIHVLLVLYIFTILTHLHCTVLSPCTVNCYNIENFVLLFLITLYCVSLLFTMSYCDMYFLLFAMSYFTVLRKFITLFWGVSIKQIRLDGAAPSSAQRAGNEYSKVKIYCIQLVHKNATDYIDCHLPSSTTEH